MEWLEALTLTKFYHIGALRGRLYIQLRSLVNLATTNRILYTANVNFVLFLSAISDEYSADYSPSRRKIYSTDIDVSYDYDIDFQRQKMCLILYRTKDDEMRRSSREFFRSSSVRFSKNLYNFFHRRSIRIFIRISVTLGNFLEEEKFKIDDSTSLRVHPFRKKKRRSRDFHDTRRLREEQKRRKRKRT